ncbi:MAG: heme-binding protein [Betaproteobacteria bacterium]|nr:heme-binding protein [Betaproteobacteria bacterium]
MTAFTPRPVSVFRPRPGRQLSAATRHEAWLFGAALVDRFGGGPPIGCKVNGWAALGVSGASEAQDEECA